MNDLALHDLARDRIAREGFTAETQSRIALMLCTVKQFNAAFHASAPWMPRLDVVQQFAVTQHAREMEAITILSRTTRWASNPGLWWDNQRITGPLAQAWWHTLSPPGPVYDPQRAWRGLSLGHAQLARIRLLAIIPDQGFELDPFAVALRRIEQENGRLLQTQIRLLKHLAQERAPSEREQHLAEDQAMVDAMFTQLLRGVAGLAPEPAAAPQAWLGWPSANPWAPYLNGMFNWTSKRTSLVD